MINKKQLKEIILSEKLILKRHNDNIVVVSDLETRKDQSQETFKNKDHLKKAGFKWDGDINSWTIDKSSLSTALIALNRINKIDSFIESFDKLPEFLLNTDNFSRKDELSQKIDSFLTKLGTELDEKAASEEIKRFFDFQAKIRNRSAYNTMLIWMQNQNATHVEGFRTWQNKFGRQVKKGAKGITILAPRTVKKDDDDKDIDGQVKKQNVRFFMAVTVFDVKDTEPIPGKEDLYVKTPDWHNSDQPNEVADKLYGYCIKLMQEMGINVTRNDANRGEMGWASGGHINITSNIDGVNKAGTLIHEIAHELLHFKKTSIFHIEQEMGKQDKEIQAESVSYIVLRHYDLPATHQSTYLAIYRANKEALQKHIEVIKKVADFIITKIDEIANEDNKMETNPTTNNPK